MVYQCAISLDLGSVPNFLEAFRSSAQLQLTILLDESKAVRA